MRLNSKGQVTIPAQLRDRFNLHEGDQVEVIEDGEALRIVRVENAETRGERLVRRLRGSGTARDTRNMTTDELMELLRGD